MNENERSDKTAWTEEFRERMDRFESHAPGAGRSASIKIRVASGCFHREHSPNAYAIIDEFLRADRERSYSFMEHENGPELLVYLSVAAAGISLAASVISLVTAIIQARAEGIKRGDKPRDPVELIVRGFDRAGKLEEEKILRFNPDDKVSRELIEKALRKAAGQIGKEKKPRGKRNG